MKIAGHFEIHDSFKIANRGIVLAGKLISEGEEDIELNPGDELQVRLYDEDRIYKIKSIEVGFSRIHGNKYFPSQNLGLLLEIDSESEREELLNWQPEKTIAVLVQTSGK